MYILEGYNKHHFALNSQHLLSTPNISKTQILVFIFFTDLSSWEPIASTYLYSDETFFPRFQTITIIRKLPSIPTFIVTLNVSFISVL